MKYKLYYKYEKEVDIPAVKSWFCGVNIKHKNRIFLFNGEQKK